MPWRRFALIGGGPLRARAIARQSSITDRVTLSGLRHDMDAVYGALDVLVVRSDTEGTALVEHEVTGLVVPPTMPPPSSP